MLTILNAGIDLVSFSEILFSIYPPLFVALIIYSVGGTWLSIRIGRVAPILFTCVESIFQSLVGLNFRQEAKEADFRFGLVRIRENVESIAFYGGERKEQNILLEVQPRIKCCADLWLLEIKRLDSELQRFARGLQEFGFLHVLLSISDHAAASSCGCSNFLQRRNWIRCRDTESVCL